MTERYLLDTSVMMLLVRGEEPGRAIDQRFGLSSATERPLVSIVTHAELSSRCSRSATAGARKG